MQRAHPGMLLFVGFDGTGLTDDLRAFFRDVRPGGFILFSRNVVEAGQTLRLIAELRGLYDPPPVVGVDEEGGRVSRLRSLAPTLPAAAELARAGPGRARALAAALGSVLAGVGFDVDFAPVVDLCRPDAPNGIGDRSFGTDPGRTVELAGAVLEGLEEGGVMGCLKHFPGLGPTLLDSHHHLPGVTKGEADFLAQDLLPYRALHGRAPLVMVGHGHYPFLSGPDPVAATLSPPIATGLLRGEIGFRGLALADDLEMKAVSARVPYGDLAPRAIAAGCDMVLVCRRREAVRACLDGLSRWIDEGRLAAERVQEALGRADALQETAARLRRTRPASSTSSFLSACDLLRERLAAA